MNDEHYILRQILVGDDTSKFSLGDAAYTPLKIFLQKTAFDFHHMKLQKRMFL